MNAPRKHRTARWNSLGFLLVGTAAFFWWANDRFLGKISRSNLQESAEYSPPPDTVPRTSQEVKDNNAIAAQGLAPDLDGTVVVYPEQVNGLIAPDGSVRTDLALGDLARVLGVNPQKIAKNTSSVEVGTNAVLFSVVIARLSEKAKSQARRVREIEVRKGMPPSAVGEEWVQTKLSFSLNALASPSDEQKLVLDAIRRRALGSRREPGARINAVPLKFDPDNEQPAIFGGYLPLEAAGCAPDDSGDVGRD